MTMRGAQESCLWLPGHLASRAAKIWELAQNVVALARTAVDAHIEGSEATSHAASSSASKRMPDVLAYPPRHTGY